MSQKSETKCLENLRHVQDSGSMPMSISTTRDQGHFERLSWAFVTHCIIFVISEADAVGVKLFLVNYMC